LRSVRSSLIAAIASFVLQLGIVVMPPALFTASAIVIW